MITWRARVYKLRDTVCRPEIGFWFVSWVFLDLRRLAHTR
jgi:hypothetical protein